MKLVNFGTFINVLFTQTAEKDVLCFGNFTFSCVCMEKEGTQPCLLKVNRYITFVIRLVISLNYQISQQISTLI